MFVFGETIEKVIYGKVALPKEFHLKDKKLMGKWKNDDTLYISDNDGSLNSAAGKGRARFMICMSFDEKLTVPDKYENHHVLIKGCISTIELTFTACVREE